MIVWVAAHRDGIEHAALIVVLIVAWVRCLPRPLNRYRQPRPWAEQITQISADMRRREPDNDQ